MESPEQNRNMSGSRLPSAPTPLTLTLLITLHQAPADILAHAENHSSVYVNALERDNSWEIAACLMLPCDVQIVHSLLFYCIFGFYGHRLCETD